MNDALLLAGVTRRYKQGAGWLNVLKGAHLSIERGEIIALVGPSGSGKSTMLQIAGLLDRPDAGKVYIDGKDATVMSDRERTMLRRTTVGFVYQFHHLLPEFSALENVMLPQLIAGEHKQAAEGVAMDLLSRMGLSKRALHRPAELSGGEQQRVAFCRAVANKPTVLLADEPTGNLDPETSETVFAELVRLVKEEGLSALIATHNLDLARRMDRSVLMKSGELSKV